MARILLVSQPALGHFIPMLPLAKWLRDNGHWVAFVSSKQFCKQVESHGFEAISGGVDWLESSTAETFPEVETIDIREQGNWYFTNLFCGVTAERMIPDLIEVIEDRKVDFLIHENWEFATPLVAEKVGIPFVTFGIGLLLPMDMLVYMIGDRIGRLRNQIGLEADPELKKLYQHLYLHHFPPSYQDPAVHLDCAVSVKPSMWSNRSISESSLSSQVKKLNIPIVFVSIGTVYNKETWIFEMIIRALANEDLSLWIAVGEDVDPEPLRALGPKCRIDTFVPYAEAIRESDLVISHSGCNAIMAALSLGVPMLNLVFEEDSEPSLHAVRCEELGVGKTLAADRLNETSLLEATKAILAEESYRGRVQQMENEISQLPTAEEHVDTLIRLFEDHSIGSDTCCSFEPQGV